MTGDLDDLKDEVEAVKESWTIFSWPIPHLDSMAYAAVAELAPQLRAGKHVQENGAWKIGFSYGEKVASDWQKLYDDAGERIAELEACIDTLITVDEPSRYYDNARVLLKPDTEAKS